MTIIIPIVPITTMMNINCPPCSLLLPKGFSSPSNLSSAQYNFSDLIADLHVLQHYNISAQHPFPSPEPIPSSFSTFLHPSLSSTYTICIIVRTLNRICHHSRLHQHISYSFPPKSSLNIPLHHNHHYHTHHSPSFQQQHYHHFQYPDQLTHLSLIFLTFSTKTQQYPFLTPFSHPISPHDHQFSTTMSFPLFLSTILPSVNSPTLFSRIPLSLPSLCLPTVSSFHVPPPLLPRIFQPTLPLNLHLYHLRKTHTIPPFHHQSFSNVQSFTLSR
eukprot:TRINITY_DN907_c0_g1_i16.p1 TRINITY_DN907_c0_g1~~TRINITY_DN907_c0_g1_i16.p1  ORF type:complete len:273 (+),score=-5.17 TRINITY_DN907_c0_g1_i16:629-1447(+)